MSSLFQALKNTTFKKKSKSKSSRQHRSKSKINDSKKKDILETKHYKLTYNSSSSSISIKQDDVDRIIGKACVEPSLDECFIIYLIKWKNKTLKESTWQHSRKLTYANQKIRWFNQNVNPKYLPNFHQQYKDTVPNYRQILESSIKRLFQTKKESKKYNRQSKEKQDKKFLKQDQSNSDQISSSKTKKIKKEGQNKPKRRKYYKFQSPQRKKKSSHKTSKKHRKQKSKKDLHRERSDKSDKHKKQYHEGKKQVKEKYKDEESFHRKLDKTLQEYFKSGKIDNKGIPDQKIPELLIQSDKVSVSTVFLENSVCQKFDDLSATEKSTNQDAETQQDFIFLSDTYKDQDFKIKLQEKQPQSQIEKSQQIEVIEFVSIQKDLQRGEVNIDEQTFLYSRSIELEEGQFNDDDYTGLIRFCG